MERNSKIKLLLSLALIFNSCEKNNQADGLAADKFEIKDGTHTKYFSDGQIMSEEQWRDGQRDGRSIYYYENGLVHLSATYNHGVKDGEWIKFYENGHIWEKGVYINGKKDGEWIYYYDKDGEVYTTDHYTDGEIK